MIHAAIILSFNNWRLTYENAENAPQHLPACSLLLHGIYVLEFTTSTKYCIWCSLSRFQLHSLQMISTATPKQPVPPNPPKKLTTKEIDDKLGYETYSKWQTKNIKSSHLIIIGSGVFAPSPLLSGNSTSELVIVTWPNLSTLWLIRFVKSSTSPTPINITNVNNSHWVLSWSDTGDKIATYDNQFKAYQIRRYLACLLNKSASRFHPSPTD